MNSKELFLGLLTATLVFTPLATLKPASATTATIANPTSNLIAQGVQLPFDPIELGKTIDEAVGKAENRAGFVKGLMEVAVPAANKGGYNVMVFNLNQDYDTDIRNTAAFAKTATYDGITYAVWIFDKGKFTNKGDGGWINWAMYGDFTREGDGGKTVTFR